jgi:plasmid stability protein
MRRLRFRIVSHGRGVQAERRGLRGR